MDRHVQLDQFPDGLRFPPEFEQRISYDAAQRRMRFSGFMSKCEFDRLSRLHSDYRYQRALEELFRVCTFSPEPERRFPMAKAAIGSVIVIIGLMAFFGWLHLYRG